MGALMLCYPDFGGLWQPLDQPLPETWCCALSWAVDINHTPGLCTCGSLYAREVCCIVHKNKYNEGECLMLRGNRLCPWLGFPTVQYWGGHLSPDKHSLGSAWLSWQSSGASWGAGELLDPSHLCPGLLGSSSSSPVMPPPHANQGPGCHRLHGYWKKCLMMFSSWNEREIRWM